MRNGVPGREEYHNCAYAGPDPAEAERRQIVLSSANVSVTDTSLSIAQARRQPFFFNGRTLRRDVTVYWELGLRPAWYQVSAEKWQRW